MTKQQQTQLLNRYTTQHIVSVFYGLSPDDTQYTGKARTVRNYKLNGLPKCNNHLISKLIKHELEYLYPKCETCKYLNKDNNYCPIIEQFNEVEFGCINHCV